MGPATILPAMMLLFLDLKEAASKFRTWLIVSLSFLSLGLV